ncbi:hypothetical protein OHU11_20190 [Streptomyces sp. NBC_00257]|uniref:hypothetical protein n=1 Tax=unclassified Streptomyces TaxID=2593676 RepID=UPI00224FC090|nr:MULTISPECIES: hypothetical protein [unclassified Streptomyces]MCX5429994.1 hypothetical protein [Streptomyces sp. NBC_00062]
MRRTTLGGAILSAALLTATAANPAQAASSVDPVIRGCSTAGSSGSITIENWTGPGATVKLSINLYDTAADGHHSRIRLVSKDTFGNRHNWPWRMNYDGQGNGKTWKTTASHTNGLFDLGVDVATFEGDTMQNACSDW